MLCSPEKQGMFELEEPVKVRGEAVAGAWPLSAPISAGSKTLGPNSCSNNLARALHNPK